MGKEEIFKQALISRKIPVLTLDNKWHKLFARTEPGKEIKQLEGELNTLLKRQGKVNTETKDIRKLKKKLMDEIVELADQLDQKKSVSIEKKIDEKKRLIAECNEKLEAYQDEILDLPKAITETNYSLMLATMELFYDVMDQNKVEIQETAQWITQMRIELKKKIVRKQEMEWFNKEVYTYMHNIFGADVIELFDMQYEPEQKPE